MTLRTDDHLGVPADVVRMAKKIINKNEPRLTDVPTYFALYPQKIRPFDCCDAIDIVRFNGSVSPVVTVRLH